MINKRLKDVLFSDQWSEHCMDTLCPFGYVLVSKEMLSHIRHTMYIYFAIIKSSLLYLYIIFHLSHLFRWRPSVCRECCCWFSLNSAISHSSEACRQRAHAQDLEDTGYVLCIEERCSEFCSEIYHIAKFVVGLCQ